MTYNIIDSQGKIMMTGLSEDQADDIVCQRALEVELPADLWSVQVVLDWD